MFVKICGLTRVEDALQAAKLGATHLGFIFADSPRRITAEMATTIREALGQAGFLKRVRTVGVFVNEQQESLLAIVKQAGLDLVQLHGDEAPEYTEGLHVPWYRALRINEDNCAVLDVRPWVQPGGLLLADTLTRGRYGGTGEQISVSAAIAVRHKVQEAGGRFVLAGGLNPENIGAAILKVRPDGVDISSGVEEKAGLKSVERLRALFSVLAPFQTGDL